MSIIKDQRMKYLKFIRPLFLKEQCELCGNKSDLELHHIEQFSRLLHDTLNELNLEYKEDASLYSKYERLMITNVMLGKQVRIKYTTVCKQCHITIHNIYGKEKVFSKGKVINAQRLEEQLKKMYDNVRIFKEDVGQLEVLFRDCGYNERSFGKYNANKFLKQLDIPLEIHGKRCKINRVQTRYWSIMTINT